MRRVLSAAFFAGLVLLATSVVRSEWFLWTAHRAEGTITGYSGSQARGRSGGTSSCAIVSFVDATGSARSVLDSVCLTAKEPIGTQVTVLYKGGDGGAVEVDGFWVRWLPRVYFVFGGLPALIMLYSIGWVVGSMSLLGRIVGADDLRAGMRSMRRSSSRGGASEGTASRSERAG